MVEAVLDSGHMEGNDLSPQLPPPSPPLPHLQWGMLQTCLCNCLTSPSLSLCRVSDYFVSLWESGWHDDMVIIYQWIKKRAIGRCF